MISVPDAIALLRQHFPTSCSVTLPLVEAVGGTLAADIHAQQAMPPFPQSAMDGYAYCFKGWQQYQQLQILGEIAAGDHQTNELSPETTTRIFTGAALPPGADTVIEQEKVRVENGFLFIEKEEIHQGQHVRPPGSEIQAGTLALPHGSTLTPGAIGFLAGIGLAEVPVYALPRISIIITGKELCPPGTPLPYGKVYESNSVALTAALKQAHFPPISITFADDVPEVVTEQLREALDTSDVVLLTGGVSVGDYDFVPEAAGNNGVTTHFHKIKQRPGKPLFFGTKGDKAVFGLPGNPASVLTCFYVYVLPELLRFAKMPHKSPALQTTVANSYKKNTGLTHFLKGWYDGQKATILDAQESYRLSSFARANCLVVLEEQVTTYAAGDEVMIYLL